MVFLKEKAPTDEKKACQNYPACKELRKQNLFSSERCLLRPKKNKINKCVSGKGSEILVRACTHNCFNYFFSVKIYIILCILKGEMPFKMHKII